jgi:pimeloyl-ACP methyl ester carboxylesterase
VADDAPGWLRGAFALAGRLSPRLASRAAFELLTRPRGRNPPQPWELEPPSTALAPEPLRLPGGIHALSWGGPGPLVLAVHGWRGRPTQFRRIAEALVPAGLRVVALEAPGHGASPGRRATPRLVLLGAPSRPSPMIAGFADRIGLPPRARRALDARFDAHAGRPVAQLDVVALALPPGVAALVVHDRDDEVIPVEEAQRLEAAWPSARFLYTNGLGHRGILADAEVVRVVADFIRGEPPRPSPAC